MTNVCYIILHKAKQERIIMSFIKLKEYCKNRSISYITGYRWFKNKQIPGAYQTESGTILIPDDFNSATKSDKTDAISLLLEKSVEFNNNEASIIDFTAYILSNFNVSLNEDSDTPKYSKNKPKTEDIQKHFYKFIPAKDNIDRLKMIRNLIKDNPNGELITQSCTLHNLEDQTDSASTYSFNTIEGTAGPNVDFESTPQQINYIGSTPAASFDSNLPSITLNPVIDFTKTTVVDDKLYAPVIEANKPLSAPRRRGRKPSKKY